MGRVNQPILADEWLTGLEAKTQAAVVNWDKKYGSVVFKKEVDNDV